MVIKEVNPPFEIRKVVIPSNHQEKITKQPTTQTSSLPLVSMNQERSIVEKAELALERTKSERT